MPRDDAATVAKRRSAARPVWRDRVLAGEYAWSWVDGLRRRRRFVEVEAFCLFIGYPRSGHSLVGSLLDAHRDAVIAHELGALAYLDRGFSRAQLYSLILRNSRRFTAAGRRARTAGYEYAVPGGHHGRCDRLRVIGDKRGGGATKRLGVKPDLLERLQAAVEVPLRLVHVVRNPYDNAATMLERRPREATLDDAVADLLWHLDVNARVRRRAPAGSVLDVRHEDFVAAPERELARVCEFLGLDAPADYLAACAAIVAGKPRRSRSRAPWTPALRARVEAAVQAHDFLRGYAYEE